MTKKKIEKIANEIVDLCIKELWWDTDIYFNNKRICVYRKDRIYYEENCNPLDYFEYANPDLISMSFEGLLYDEIYSGFETSLTNLLEKYGLYYELGNSWNLSVYEMED